MRMWRRTWSVHPGALAAVVLVALLSAACGVFAEQPVIASPTPLIHPNVLVNSGFESGAEPWFARESSAGLPVVQLTDQAARSGDFSLALSIDSSPEQTSAVSQAVQRIQGDVFPEFVSGYYYVADWEPGDASQYVAFTVSIQGGNHPDGTDVHELRFVLAGAAGEPEPPADGAYVFLSRDEPAKGEWTYFAYPLLEAVRTRLDWDPIGWEHIDLSFEVRYDQKPSDATATATVRFDDLYFGPQVFSPNPDAD